jgi:HEAT repeat protein
MAASPDEPGSSVEVEGLRQLPPGRTIPASQELASASAPPLVAAAASTGPKATTEFDEAKHEALVEARTDELRDLARKTDPASLETLLTELRNTDPEIRQAALDALSQSGNRDAIPRLQQVAAQTENPRERQDVEEVIEFLKLPTLTELLKQNAAQGR